MMKSTLLAARSVCELSGWSRWLGVSSPRLTHTAIRGASPLPRRIEKPERSFSTAPIRCFRAVEYLQSNDPDLTDSQRTVREVIAKICSNFPDEYWRTVDETKRWPIEFTTAIAKDGWLGIMMPEEYGGSNLGLVRRKTSIRHSRCRRAYLILMA